MKAFNKSVCINYSRPLPESCQCQYLIIFFLQIIKFNDFIIFILFLGRVLPDFSEVVGSVYHKPPSTSFHNFHKQKKTNAPYKVLKSVKIIK